MDTEAEILAQKEQIKQRALVKKDMPPKTTDDHHHEDNGPHIESV